MLIDNFSAEHNVATDINQVAYNVLNKKWKKLKRKRKGNYVRDKNTNALKNSMITKTKTSHC